MGGVADDHTLMPDRERITEVDVSEEMRGSYLEYAYSVIYARALPDARDGLKPVQRRILYQMGQMGLSPDHGHVKSQRVVGEVMGKLHPHGDAAIYDALVRMAQDFTMRVPLVDGHGNFGSLDDGPAAPRYTEARLAPAALELTRDLDEDVVDFVPNYDNQLTQPKVLPAGYPNLLVNGASGIAVGMATNIPPHNLAETVAAALHLLAHPEASTSDLMREVPGPDLPAGGIVVGLDGIRAAYETGRGAFRTRARAHVERVSARKRGLVITELPYLVGPERVIEKIKEAVSSGRLKGVSDVQNLTDRHHGMRLVVEVKNGFNPDAVLAQLFRLTPLEDSFSINCVALVEGRPRTLGLKALLQIFLDHRLEVTRRRCVHRLGSSRDRLHLVEGLLTAIVDIDHVIAIIRSSDDVDQARTRLVTAFDLDEVQANYILELRLRRLTKFSRIELETQRDDLRSRIGTLQAVLDSPAKLRGVVASDLRAVAARLGTPRRTVLLAEEGAAAPHAAPPLQIPDAPCRVVLTVSGALARVEGGDPLRGPHRARNDLWRIEIPSTARGQVAVVTADGRAHRLDVVDLPSLPRGGLGISLAPAVPAADLLHVSSPACGLYDPGSSAPLALATRRGIVKRLRPGSTRGETWEVIRLGAGDQVVDARPCPDEADLVLISSDARLLRMRARDVRPQAAAARGIAGMRVAPRAGVVAFGAPTAPGDAVVASAAGAAGGRGAASVKVTPLGSYPVHGRGGRGVRVQRLLRGEERILLAWVGPRPAHASDAAGAPVSLPREDPRRDASGSPTSQPIAALG